LAAVQLVNRQEAFRRRRTRSVLVTITQAVAQMCAFVGAVVGFWHILWIAGVGILTVGLVAVGVHSAGWWRLERDQPPTGEDPGDAEA
jgi:fatty acid desaturase